MIGAEDFTQQYFFTDEDRANIERAGKILLPYADHFTRAFYDHISSFPEMGAVFPVKQAAEERAGQMHDWFTSVFTREHDNRYLAELARVGRTHVKRKIPIHWVTSSMSFKRGYMLEVLEKEVSDDQERLALEKSLHKILDMNLDVLLSSYHEEQLKRTFLTERMDSGLIRVAERFAYGLNLILVLALIGLAVGVSVLFVTEVIGLVTSPDLARGIISTLGTLLIIWVIVELVGTEIRYLRGESFRIEIFVAVALVSVIRELLITTLGHEASPLIAYLAGSVLILGVVYYLISKAEFRR